MFFVRIAAPRIMKEPSFVNNAAPRSEGVANRQIKKQLALQKQGRLRENRSLRKPSFYGAALPRRALYYSPHIKPERILLQRIG